MIAEITTINNDDIEVNIMEDVYICFSLCLFSENSAACFKTEFSIPKLPNDTKIAQKAITCEYKPIDATSKKTPIIVWINKAETPTIIVANNDQITSIKILFL